MHGYVHGHIHRHRDHTHIHGHIHSHNDPLNQPQQPPSQSRISGSDSNLNPLGYTGSDKANSIFYPENQPDGITDAKANGTEDNSSLLNCPLEELPLCDEVLCSELDDCYYSSCTDANFDQCCAANFETCNDPDCISHEDLEKITNNHLLSATSAKVDSNVGDSNKHSPGSNEVICNNPNCLQNGDATVCCYDDTHTKNHNNNLCMDNHDKKIFTQMFAEFQKDYNKSINNISENPTDTSPTKVSPTLEQLSSAMTSFINSKDIHYPHEIHPIDNIHKAFFHTNIDEPNLYNGNNLTDFDFHFRFNNHCNTPSDSSLAKPKLEELNKQFEKQNQPQPFNNQYTFPCKWDNNCFSTVSNDNFLNHIVNDHFKDFNLDPANPNANVSSPTQEFNCEWGDCKYSFESLDSFLNHLATHKLHPTFNVPTPESTNSVTVEHTPNSITPKVSPDLSVNFPATAAHQVSKLSGLNNNSDDSNYGYFQESPRSSRHDCKVNISNLQIKAKKPRDPIDANFTCQWDIGSDEHSEPVKCGKSHHSAGDLQEHVINDHIGSGKSCYNCKWVGCERHKGKNFPQRQKLLRHIHIHTNHKPWTCKVCGSTFAVESMLIQHLRIHSGEKPFKCNVCGKRFATSSSLSIHHRIHTGEKPLVCKFPGCNKKFSESSNLTKHMKTHFKAFPCKICGETFDRKSNYLRHMQLHQQGSLKVKQEMTPDSAAIGVAVGGSDFAATDRQTAVHHDNIKDDFMAKDLNFFVKSENDETIFDI